MTALYQSPTLLQLDATHHPLPEVACVHCPNSVWFTTKMSKSELVKCYCRVMFLVSWSTTEPTAITLCDGPQIGQEAETTA